MTGPRRRASTPSRWRPRWSRCRSRTCASTSATAWSTPDRTPAAPGSTAATTSTGCTGSATCSARGSTSPASPGCWRWRRRTPPASPPRAAARSLRGPEHRGVRGVGPAMTTGAWIAGRRRRAGARLRPLAAPPTDGRFRGTHVVRRRRRRGGREPTAEAGPVDDPPGAELVAAVGEHAGRAGHAAAVLQRLLRALPGHPPGPGRRRRARAGRGPRRGRRRAPPRRRPRLGVLRTPTTLVLDARGRRGDPGGRGADAEQVLARWGAGLMSTIWMQRLT